MPLFLLDALEAINNFFQSGGPVLYLIAILTIFLWTLILERFWYFHGECRKDVASALDIWTARNDRYSWFADVTREKLISEVRLKINENLSLIKTIIALCPLFGLMGTVTGMIDVFTILSITGGGDAKSMAGGVSRATIPTMAGMVAALSGVFANIYINQIASERRHQFEEQLVMNPAEADSVNRG